MPGEGRDATQCLSWEFLPMAANSGGTIASWPSGTSAAKHASRHATGGVGDFARETFAWADQRLANQPSAGVSDHPAAQWLTEPMVVSVKPEHRNGAVVAAPRNVDSNPRRDNVDSLMCGGFHGVGCEGRPRRGTWKNR